MLVSPTEPPQIRALGRTSSLPERKGCDVWFKAKGLQVGVQRKETQDLLASLSDGRLAKELAQMKCLDVAMVLLEGDPQWTLDGDLMGKGYGQRFTKQQWYGVQFAIQSHGYWLLRTENLRETVEALGWVEDYLRKEGPHNSLRRRPGPISAWGSPSNTEYAIHLVQGLPGVGPELASRIVEVFGGAPWQWRITEADLTGVPGIGKKKAEQIYRSL